ncbi:hypothetical protein MTO96_010211 [Rhipicephalus appendiculatus]
MWSCGHPDGVYRITRTALGKPCHADTPLEVRSSKTIRAADFVCALAGSLSASCASVVTRTRSYFEHRTRLRAASSNIVTVKDQQLQQRRSSCYCQQRQHQLKEHPQKRRDAGVGAAESTDVRRLRRGTEVVLDRVDARVVCRCCGRAVLRELSGWRFRARRHGGRGR